MPLKTYRFDILDFIKEPDVAIEYLKVVLEEGDDADIRRALNNLARAQGISGLARATGLSREALYKAFGENGNPTLSTLLAVFKALGIKMSVVQGATVKHSRRKTKAAVKKAPKGTASPSRHPAGTASARVKNAGIAAE